jgi:transcriptional regulator with XRE-family HTH domain
MAYLLAHRALPSSTVAACVRARAGITQQELGDLLGVGRAQVAHVEAGRRGFSARAQSRLSRLAELLPAGAVAFPPADAHAPVGPAVLQGPTLAEQTALHRRLRACRHQLAGLRYAEEGRPALASALARRTLALAKLRAALALDATTTSTSREVAWLELVELATARVARQQPTATAQQWLALRLRLLQDEEAGLLALLAT